MNQDGQNQASRRAFLKNTGRLAAASALAGVMVPHVHAAESNTIHVALIGCGGRGTGAAANALSADSGPIKLVAMADVFENRLKGSYGQLKKHFGDKVDVPEDRKFIGFDGYQKAMDCLKPGDVVIFATPPAFRWVHFGYAIEKGLNVFMEKPVTVDGPTTRKMLALAEESREEKPQGRRRPDVPALQGPPANCQADQGRRDRRDHRCCGPIACTGPIGSCFIGPKPDGISELLYQIQRFHSFLWASGGCFSDFYIHNIDECCWMKDAWPVKAQATRRPALSRRLRSIRTSTPIRSNTPSPTAPSCSSTAATSPAATTSSPATPTAPRARRSSRRSATRRPSAASTRARTSARRRPGLGVSAATSRIRISWSGTI